MDHGLKRAKRGFSGVVPRDSLKLTENGDKLAILVSASVIQRFACRACGVHTYGRIENKAHRSHGLDFIHPELGADEGWAPPLTDATSTHVEDRARGLNPRRPPPSRRAWGRAHAASAIASFAAINTPVPMRITAMIRLSTARGRRCASLAPAQEPAVSPSAKQPARA